MRALECVGHSPGGHCKRVSGPRFGTMKSDCSPPWACVAEEGFRMKKPQEIGLINVADPLHQALARMSAKQIAEMAIADSRRLEAQGKISPSSPKGETASAASSPPSTDSSEPAEE